MQKGQRGLKLRTSFRGEGASILGTALEIVCQPDGFELRSKVVMLAEIKGKPRAVARIDINGSKHENPLAICGEWQHLDAGHTHFHDLNLHKDLSLDELFGRSLDLPVARPLHDFPRDFREAMEKCGELLHIENLSEVEEPQWQPKQFLF